MKQRMCLAALLFALSLLPSTAVGQAPTVGADYYGPREFGNMRGYWGAVGVRTLNFYMLPKLQWYGYLDEIPYLPPLPEFAPIVVPYLPAGNYVTFAEVLTSTGTPAALPAKAPPVTTASLKVYVPTNQAELSVNGQMVPQTGKEREIVTPDLEAKTATYTVRVRWQADGQEFDQTRTLTLRSGGQVVCAFTADNPPPGK
jgi:uncharacterized protein (TIGR03000 family)